MNPTHPWTQPSPDERLDGLLTAQPVTPAPDFAARTLARVQAESAWRDAVRAGAQAPLETLWLNQAVTPAPDFAERTLHRIHGEAARLMAAAAGDEKTLDTLLAARPIRPAPDFAARTLARIQAENELSAAARTGSEDAIDALLDQWLAEQPLDPAVEPVFAAESARRPAAPRSRAVETPRRLWFPIWARSAAGLAAAAAVAFMVLFNGRSNLPQIGLTAQVARLSLPAPALSDGPAFSMPDPDAENTPAMVANDDLSSLSDSLNDGAALFDQDSVEVLNNSLSNYPAANGDLGI